jgi:DNA-binding response OmpR family regulator
LRSVRSPTAGRLRRKLGDPPVIATTLGIGYRIA